MAAIENDRLREEVGRLLGNRQLETDPMLLKHFSATGDSDAFHALLLRHGPMVMGVCRRILQNLHDAEDAFQAVFLVLARKAVTLQVPATLGPWLHVVASRVARRLRTMLQLRHRREQSFSASQEECISMEAMFPDDLRELLDEELSRLPARFRMPLVLCYLQGKTTTEAAEELGCARGSVCGWLARGKQLLHERLIRRGVSLTALTLTSVLTPAALAKPISSDIVKATVDGAIGRTTFSAVVSTLADHALHQGISARLSAMWLLTSALGLGSLWLAWAALDRPNPQHQHTAIIERKPTKKLIAWQAARTIQFEGQQQLHALAFDPSGKLLATASADGKVKIWHTATGKLASEPLSFVSPALALRFSRDAKSLTVVGAPNEVVVWDLEKNREKSRRQLGNVFLTAAYLSEDEKTLAGISSAFLAGAFAMPGAIEPVHVWDLSTGKRLRGIAGHALVSSQLSLSPDGKTIATAGARPRQQQVERDGTPLGVSVMEVKLWDARVGKETILAEGGLSIAQSPDGKLLAFGSCDEETGQPNIILWDLRAQRKVQVFSRAGDAVNQLVFSSDSKLLAAAGNDGVVNIWDLTGAKKLAELKKHNTGVTCLAFSLDGAQLASADWSGVIQIWEASAKQD